MIKIFPSGPLDTNVYLFIDEPTKKACLIDPGPDSFEKIQTWCQKEQITITAIAITHSHWDHVQDIPLFLEAYPTLNLFAHPLDQDNLLSPGFDGISSMVPISPLPKERIESYPPELIVGTSVLKVLHTPGHSPGCVCLYEPREHLLFSGDTLFAGTYGLTSLPTSSRRDMFASLKQLADLPEETKIYPGHGHSSTIKKEKGWIERVVAAQLKY